MTYDYGLLNLRGNATGNPADSQTFAPTARVGLYVDCRWSPNLANRGNAWINPHGPESTPVQPVYPSWQAYWDREFDPMHQWFAGGGTTRNLLAVFESPYGHQGLHRRDHTIDERQKAIEQGKPWLVDGFCEGAKAYIDGGAEIFVHEGCPDLGRLAADTLADGSARGKHALWQAQRDFVEPHMAVGMGIGFDFLSAMGAETASYGLWKWLVNVGWPVHMESTFGPERLELYRGATCLVHYEQSFKPWHTEPQAEYAGPKGWKMPLAGSQEFADWYGEVRVVVPYDFGGSGAQTKENIEHQADECRRLLALAPNIRVLLIDWIVRGAMQTGVPIERFLLETPK